MTAPSCLCVGADNVSICAQAPLAHPTARIYSVGYQNKFILWYAPKNLRRGSDVVRDRCCTRQQKVVGMGDVVCGTCQDLDPTLRNPHSGLRLATAAEALKRCEALGTSGGPKLAVEQFAKQEKLTAGSFLSCTQRKGKKKIGTSTTDKQQPTHKVHLPTRICTRTRTRCCTNIASQLVKMHLMCNVDAVSGKRVYTLKKILEGKITKSAHPARFSPDDKWSKHRVLLRKRFGRLPGVKGMCATTTTLSIACLVGWLDGRLHVLGADNVLFFLV